MLNWQVSWIGSLEDSPNIDAGQPGRVTEARPVTDQTTGSDELAQYRYPGVGEPRDLAPDSLEFFLLERYYLFARRAGSLVRGQVSHAPYRPRDVEVQLSSALPARLDGFTELPDAPEHVCFVDGFDVNIYATEKLA